MLTQAQINKAKRANSLHYVAPQGSYHLPGPKHGGLSNRSSHVAPRYVQPLSMDQKRRRQVSRGTRSGVPAKFKPSVYGQVDLNSGLSTVDWNGKQAGGSLTLNSSAAPRFQDFLQALQSEGYDPGNVLSYANRNIAGTNRRSLHSYGLAIDINPGSNGVSYGPQFNTDMPKNVGRLAKRYGLTWGGDWKGSKKDPMHFSFPAYGTM